jgi:hypothetical protein
MKLYRGYKTEPRFLTKDLEYELQDLQALFDDDELPKGSIQRFKALRKIADAQFFTDDREIATEFAGKNGFLVEIDIDSRTALDLRREQVMAPRKNMRYSSNVVFSGRELAQNLKEWKVAIISLQKERERNINLLPKIPLR